MKKFFTLMAMITALAIALVPGQKQAAADDFIDLDLTGVSPAVRGVFRQAEAFWERRINGFSNQLPTELRQQLTGRLLISAETTPIDGPGGILGAAGPDNIAFYQEFAGTRARPNLVRQYALPTTSSMFFDVFDANVPGFDVVVRHEMGHALGIGSLWQQNGLIDLDDADFRQGLLQERRGNLQYIGQHGLKGFRDHSGHHRANYVPVEQGGGDGTALGHWDSDNWFFNPRNGSRSELMIGFLTGRPTFVSEATYGSLADIGYSVDGFNAQFGTLRQPGLPSRPQFPKSGFGGNRFFLTAVPEPSSGAFICLALVGTLVRRNRS